MLPLVQPAYSKAVIASINYEKRVLCLGIFTFLVAYMYLFSRQICVYTCITFHIIYTSVCFVSADLWTYFITFMIGMNFIFVDFYDV